MNELMKKLNYKKGTVQILNAPAEFRPFMEAWATECRISTPASGAALERPVDFLMIFAKNAEEARTLSAECRQALESGAVFWVAYPKQTSKRYKADINRDSLWPILETLGFRPNRQVAIDEDWSALRFGRCSQESG